MSDRRKEQIDCAVLVGITTALIVLKVCGVVNWNWWIILAPIWAPLALGILFALATVIWCMFPWRHNNG